MDITSYLLGKKASGGGGIDWSEIGYDSTPNCIQKGFDYAKQIYDNWDSEETTIKNKYKNNDNLVFMPLVDTSNVTDMNSAFYGCKNLLYVPKLNTSNVTDIANMFANSKVIEIAELDASSVIKTTYVLQYASSLINFGGFKNIGEAYLTTAGTGTMAYEISLSNCTNLTHDSLMNVINNLYDIKTKGCNNQKLILGNTNLAKLSAEEIAIATNKGWDVS